MRLEPGSTPSGYAGTCNAPEHPWVGPAFPPHAQSLFQAVINISATRTFPVSPNALNPMIRNSVTESVIVVIIYVP